MIEIFIIGAIILFIFLYTGKISSKDFVEDNIYIFNLLKEPDYEFLLYAKYGDRVYDPNQVFMKRVRNGALTIVLGIFVFISSLTFINIVICILIGFLVFKSQYFDLKKYYRQHLNEVDSLLPYYLKGLEILIQHYTVPVALARSIEDAPEYRLGLGEQEKKHAQLVAFSKSVSNLQQKARETKYKLRLGKMESMTMIMLVCTGGGGMIILLVAMFMMMSNI